MKDFNSLDLYYLEDFLLYDEKDLLKSFFTNLI